MDSNLYLTGNPEKPSSYNELCQYLQQKQDTQLTHNEQLLVLLAAQSFDQVQRASIVDFVITSEMAPSVLSYLLSENLLTYDQEVFLKVDQSNYHYIPVNFQLWCCTLTPVIRVLRPSMNKYLSEKTTLYPNLHQSIARWLHELQTVLDEGDQALATYLLKFQEYEPVEYVELFIKKETIHPFVPNALFQFFVFCCQYKVAFEDLVLPYIDHFRTQIAETSKEVSSAKQFLVSQFDAAATYLQERGFAGFANI